MDPFDSFHSLRTSLGGGSWKRDPDFRAMILRIYERRFLVCGWDAMLDNTDLALEAALFAGAPPADPTPPTTVSASAPSTTRRSTAAPSTLPATTGTLCPSMCEAPTASKKCPR